MLVTTAALAGRRTKVPSDSSASTTIQSPLPWRALVPYALMMPPLITVGSSLAASSSAAISDVVVVLPWVPATAIAHFRRISSPSISARRTTGTRAPRAASISGLSGLIAEDITTTPHSAEIGGAMADRHRDAEAAQALGVGVLGDVGALDPMAEAVQHLGDPAHADAADPDEVNAARIERQRPHASASMCVLTGAGAASDCTSSASAPAASVRPSAAARSRHRRQLLRLLEADLHLARQRRGSNRVSSISQPAAGPAHRLGVGALVVLGGEAEGHQQRRPAERQQLGDAGRPGPGDDQMARPPSARGRSSKKAASSALKPSAA